MNQNLHSSVLTQSAPPKLCRTLTMVSTEHCGPVINARDDPIGPCALLVQCRVLGEGVALPRISLRSDCNRGLV